MESIDEGTKIWIICVLLLAIGVLATLTAGTLLDIHALNIGGK